MKFEAKPRPVPGDRKYRTVFAIWPRRDPVTRAVYWLEEVLIIHEGQKSMGRYRIPNQSWVTVQVTTHREFGKLGMIAQANRNEEVSGREDMGQSLGSGAL